MKVSHVAAIMLLSGCSGIKPLDLKTTMTPELTELQTSHRIPGLMEAFGVSGLAVTAVSGTEILLAEGYGETQEGEAFTSSTRCGLFSATKVLASIAYAKLDAEGHFKLNVPLGSLIEDAPAEWRSIPFFRLLNHTSGVAMAVNKEAFGTLASDPQATNKSVYNLIRDEPLDYQPGAFSRYRQSGYAIAEMILQDKLGKDFSSLVDEYIVKPADLTSTAHPATSDAAQPAFLLSAGGYETTADDMAKLFLAINDGNVVDAADWKNVLLSDGHLFDDYSLGSVIERRDGVMTLGHSGGGARANVRYAPDERIGVMVCTDDRSNNWLAMQLARMLIQEITSGELPPLPLLVALAGYSDMTGVQVIAAFTQAKGEESRYDFSDAEQILTEIGYGFLAENKITDAMQVLQFITQQYPMSPNAHDSLGEALLASGDSDAALAQYRHVLLLDPANENALKMIEAINERLDDAKMPK